MNYNSRLLLWADDDADDIYLIKLALPQDVTSFEIKFFSKGTDLLKYIQTEKIVPNMIVLDYNMPELNGKSVLQRLRKDERLNSTPIIMISTSHSIMHECANEGATECYEKPTKLGELKNIITRIITMMNSNGQQQQCAW